MPRSPHAAPVLVAAALALAGAGLTGCGAQAGSSRSRDGRVIFRQAGCGSCHTLAAAGSHGQTGPDLDLLKPSVEAVAYQVAHGGGGMPGFAGSLSGGQIRAVARYVAVATGGH